MHTKIKVIEDGRIIHHVTQQYKVGLYIIINNDPRLQVSSDKEERKYHISLRKKVLKDEKVQLIGGTLLDYSGKEPINTFN